MSTRNPSHGTKVSDPKAPTINEGAGAVVSDSLAAESTRSAGGFSENRDSEPLGVSGSNSTFANTNTSGAVRLNPATDSEARQAEEDWAKERRSAGSTSYPDAAGGQSKIHAVESVAAGSTSGGHHADIAPSYVTSQYTDTTGPKGANLKNGGFTGSDSKNASFNNEIGTKNDPARVAIEQLQKRNADNADMAGFPGQTGARDENVYGALDRNASE